MTAHPIGRAIPLLVVLLLGACVPGVPVSPLAAAARGGDLVEMDRLIAAGANINEPSGTNGWPPVMHAIHKGQRLALARLLDRGASITGRTGRQALFMASGYGDADSVALLLAHGAPLPEDGPSAASLIAVTVGGAWDIDYQWSGCDRHAAVAKLLVARDPDLRVVGELSPTSVARARSTVEYRVAHWYAERKGCTELLRLVDAR